VLSVAEHATAAQYVLPAGEPYARAVVETSCARLILNPVVRTFEERPVVAASTRGPGRVPLAAGLILLVL
jgi:hypothetical protein